MNLPSWLTPSHRTRSRSTHFRPRLTFRPVIECLESREVPATLAITDVTLAEGTHSRPLAVFTVTLSEPVIGTVTVNYQTADGSAKAGSDYLAAAGTLTFAPGETSKRISIEIIGDTKDEANETFAVNLSAAVNADIWDSQGLGLILNDDYAKPRCKGPHCG